MTRLFALLAVLSALWMLGASAAGAQSAVEVGPEPTDSVPNLAFLTRGSGVSLEEGRRVELNQALVTVPGVHRVTSTRVVDAEDPNLAVFYLVLDAVSGRTASVDSVVADATEILSAELPAAELLVGGPAAADLVIAERFDGTLGILIVVGMFVGAGLGLVFGWQRGLVGAATMVLSVLTAGVLGQRTVGVFEGSMAATVVPGALAGLVVGTAILVRLLFWFRDPRGADGAEMIRRSIVSLLPELALTLCGLGLAAVVVGLMDPGPSPLTAMTMGAFVAAVVQLGITAPGLALLVASREAKSELLPFTIPDGRDLPLLALSAVVALLLVLAAFGFGRPAASLLGTSDLADDNDVVEVAEVLRTGGGDATSAVVATASSAASQVDLAEWGRAAAELSTVEWVQVGGSRYSSVGVVDLGEAEALLDPSVDGVAAVVFNRSPRSEEGRAALAEVEALPLIGGPPLMAGASIEAAGASGDRSTLLMAVLMLAVTGAIAVRVLTQSVGQSVVSLVLRLLGGMAILGLFGLLSGETAAATMVTALGAIWLGVGLFELEFLTQFHQRAEFPEHARSNPGQAGMLSLLALGVASVAVGLFSPLWGGPGTATLGFVTALAVAIELTVGALLLRPALLGQRAAFHTVVRPVRVALHSGIEREQPYTGVEDPGWRRIIGDLLQAEFRFQSEPGHAALSGVFVPDTPLYRQAASHHASLAGAGLRIVGKSPKLRSIKTVSGRAPITLAVTVDHPERHLVDSEGTVVGVRKAERRSGVLWLSESDDGSYRIAESVELGSVALSEEPPVPESEPYLDEISDLGPDDRGDDGHGELDEELDHLYIDDLHQPHEDRDGTGDPGHSEQERTGS